MVDVKYRNDRIRDLEAENARLRAQVGRLQEAYGAAIDELTVKWIRSQPTWPDRERVEREIERLELVYGEDLEPGDLDPLEDG